MKTSEAIKRYKWVAALKKIVYSQKVPSTFLQKSYFLYIDLYICDWLNY